MLSPSFTIFNVNKGDVHKVRSKNNAFTSFSGVSNESKVL